MALTGLWLDAINCSFYSTVHFGSTYCLKTRVLLLQPSDFISAARSFPKINELTMYTRVQISSRAVTANKFLIFVISQNMATPPMKL